MQAFGLKYYLCVEGFALNMEQNIGPKRPCIATSLPDFTVLNMQMCIKF